MDRQPSAPNRRRFLFSLLAVIATGLAGTALYPLLRYLSPVAPSIEKNRILLSRDIVAVGGAYFFTYRQRPAVLLQNRPGAFSAFSAVCTHLGCIVQWLPERGEFLCPCHAGRFSADGKVLAGPPPRPLDIIPVSVTGDKLVVGEGEA